MFAIMRFERQSKRLMANRLKERLNNGESIHNHF
jgi:hypothetical protein